MVVDREGKLVALVYPDQELLAAEPVDNLQDTLTASVKAMNNELPAYSRISSVEIRDEEFIKTPKKSIKRYLYK